MSKIKTPKQALKYCQKVKKALFIPHHKIYMHEGVLEEEESDFQPAAQVECDPEYLGISITLFPTFYDDDEQSQKESLIHEILHYFFWFWRDVLSNNSHVENLLSNACKEDIKKDMNYNEERSIETLSMAIYKLIEG